MAWMRPPPLHMFRMCSSNGKYFGACIGCKWRGRLKASYEDANYVAKLHCETANLAELAKTATPRADVKENG